MSNDTFSYERRILPDRIVHIPNGDVEAWTHSPENGLIFWRASPDGTRFVATAFDEVDSEYLVDVERDVRLMSMSNLSRPNWFPDSSSFVAVLDPFSGHDTVGLYDRDGQFVKALPRLMGWSIAISPDGTKAAFTSIDDTSRGRIYYADFEEEVIYDLCLVRVERGGPGIDFHYGKAPFAWSPDSTTLAFTYDGFPILLNIETMQNQVLRYETGEIIAWLPPPKVFPPGRG